MKTILLTGATDGIGLATARLLAAKGHRVLLHGRNPAKLETVQSELAASGGNVEGYLADLSRISEVEALARSVADSHQTIDVLINNAGVFNAPDPVTRDGLDIRFVVNTIAPYLLTKRLLPLLGSHGRVVNLSSAAQEPVDLAALAGKSRLPAATAYAQSKLAITMWTAHLAATLAETGPVLVSVNPASLLGSKMVREAFGIAGGDLSVGADILVRAALSDEFANASGQYYDNDSRRFAKPHPHALDPQKNAELTTAIESILNP